MTLYLHCGLPHTGTTSLQVALSKHRDQLAEAGIDYPERRRLGGDWHSEVVALLNAGDGGVSRIDRFLDYLSSKEDRAVLISDEVLSRWLLPVERASLIDLLRVVQGSSPVVCLWTLRRADRWIRSRYTYLLSTGRATAPLAEYSREYLNRPGEAFAGFREVGAALEREIAFSRYDASGAHHREILRTIGAPSSLCAEIDASLRAGPRRNRALSQKMAAVLLHRQAISARVGVELPAARLQQLFRSGEFSFADDAPCEPMDADIGDAIHAKALQSAVDAGFDRYPQFFGDAGIEPRTPVSLAPDVVSDGDLDRLVDHLELAQSTPRG